MNQLSVLGSHMCPNTMYAIMKLKDAGILFTYKDISSSLADLRALLELRDHQAQFEDWKKEGKIGIPCFVLSDGTITFDLNQVLVSEKSQ